MKGPILVRVRYNTYLISNPAEEERRSSFKKYGRGWIRRTLREDGVFVTSAWEVM